MIAYLIYIVSLWKTKHGTSGACKWASLPRPKNKQSTPMPDTLISHVYKLGHGNVDIHQ